MATGAVANADQFNVVENPDDYINIVGISNPAGTSISNANSNKIEPYIMDGSFQLEAASAYTMSAEVLIDGTLEQVAFCLYDSLALDDDTKVSNNCDTVSRDGSDNLEASFTHADGDDKASALTAIYMPGVTEDYFGADAPSTGDIVRRADRHMVSLEDTAADVPSVVTIQDTLGGDNKGTNSVVKVDIKFALSDLAVNSTGWKLRVLAQYKDGADVTEVVAKSSDSYTVSYLGTLTTTARGNVNYGDVIAGNDVTKSPISTGRYRANNTSDITIKADSKFSGPSGTTDPTFDTDGTPTGNQVSLACNANAETRVFFDNISAESFLKDVPSLLNAPSPVTNKTGDLDTDDHECTLFVGNGVQVGTYSADMTVGVGPAVG